MRNGLLVVIFALVVSCGVPDSALAHHAFAWADNDHPITLSGVATQFVFQNPHSQIWFDVKSKDGSLEHWMIEIGPPTSLRRANWNEASIKPGDQITVTGGAAKDGRKILNITGKLIVNGEELSTRSN
jgi:hypothetical protein